MSLVTDWQRALQERIVLEVTHPFIVIYSVFTTTSYLYPFKGILFFIQNYVPLLPLYLSIFIPYGLLHLYIFSILLFALLPINLFIYTLTNGPIGVQIAIIITIQQCSYFNNYIFKNFLIRGKLNKIFDTTLCLVGLDRIVIPGKLKRKVPQTIIAQILEINPISLTCAIASIIYQVVISFIPIVGSLLLSYNKAINTTATLQNRFAQLTRQRPRQIKYTIKEHEAEFFSFGFTCQLLESIPFFGVFFCFTDCIGAALMAADAYRGNPDTRQQLSAATGDLSLRA